jgi:hypothetical protein
MTTSSIVLRIVLLAVGAVMIALGLNVGLGGIPTLGWQGSTDFVSVTNVGAFAAQDNHVRFLGGFWLGAGLLTAAGAVFLNQLRPVLTGIAAMVFVGGLARLSVGDLALVTSAAILPSLAAELVLFPMLALWLWHRPR